MIPKNFSTMDNEHLQQRRTAGKRPKQFNNGRFSGTDKPHVAQKR